MKHHFNCFNFFFVGVMLSSLSNVNGAKKLPAPLSNNALHRIPSTLTITTGYVTGPSPAAINNFVVWSQIDV